MRVLRTQQRFEHIQRGTWDKWNFRGRVKSNELAVYWVVITLHQTCDESDWRVCTDTMDTSDRRKYSTRRCILYIHMEFLRFFFSIEHCGHHQAGQVYETHTVLMQLEIVWVAVYTDKTSIHNLSKQTVALRRNFYLLLQHWACCLTLDKRL